MSNLPEVKIGVVAVSRDCFPESLSVNRRKASDEGLYREVWIQTVSMSARYVS